MSDVIEFMDWQELRDAITLINQQVAGMTPAEAEAALGAFKNSNLYIANTNSTLAGSSVINFPGTTATQAAADYIAGGGSTAASGAATGLTGDAVTTANVAIGQTRVGQAATAVYGVLSTPLPTAAAALAPLAGVALGIGLYESNPDFWEKVSRTLLPFCYDDSEVMPAVTDADGNTYYSQDAINAFKNFIIEQGIGEPFKKASNYEQETYYKRTIDVPVSTQGVWDGTYGSLYHIVYTPTDGSIVYSNSPSHVSLLKKGSSTFTGTQTFNDKETPYTYSGSSVIIARTGEQVYVRDLPTTTGGTWSPSTVIVTSGEGTPKVSEIADVILNGNSHESYPQGVSKWQGETYPSTATPINILTGYDNDGKPIYTPYYPVANPIGDPGVTNDPAIVPNPSVNPNPAPAINPYINPVQNPNNYPEQVPTPAPAPIPNPVPGAQPVPNPDADPSQDTEKAPDKDPETPKDPIDNGTTPTPIIPTIPVLPSAATGLLHVYNPTQSQIDSFGSWLWTTFSGDLLDTLSKLFNDPMDAVIGLHELYATPSVNGSANIRCGYLDSGIGANLVGSRYTTINCGSVVVQEYYQNYLDYSPYTNCFIYLPFVGIVPVSSDDIVGNAVNVTYHIDSYTGCCIAVVTVAKDGYSSTVYQFEGNCAVEIPISSGYQSSLMSGLLAVAGTAITSSPSVGLTAAHIGRAGLGKNTVQHSGSFGSSYGAMGSKVPYIIVKRPVQKKVYNYSQSYGYPAHKMVYVGNCENYLRAKEVRVTSTTATNEEKDMIVALLKSGVYVKGGK